MNPPKILLAKSLEKLPRPEEGYLVTHSLRVLEAAKAILKEIEPALKDLDIDLKRLEVILLIACLLHDLGKANSAFDHMVRHGLRSQARQPLWHEFLTFLLMIDREYLGKWLKEALGEEVSHAIAACSAGGHHLRLNMSGTNIDITGIRQNQTIQVYGSHKNIRYLLRVVASLLKPCEAPPNLQDITISFIDDDVQKTPEEWLQDAIDYVEPIIKNLDKQQMRLLVFTKALTISADVAGSALPSAREKPSKWISSALGKRLEQSHLDAVISEKRKGRKIRLFQEQVGASPKSVTLVIAGCGNGKTLAAYIWALKHAIGRKLFFCYPTTGTASAGYEDYLHAQTDSERDLFKRALIHSRSEIDLEMMAGTPDDDAYEENQRLESLKAWGQQAIVCTADTVLGLIQNHRRSLFSLPAIMCGAFVFDEIHNYDKRMFGSLLRFLEVLPSAPVLLMSASIPESRLKKLREKLGDRLSDPIEGDPDLESIPRYILRRRRSSKECWPDVERAVKLKKQKVLWICNTVSDARKVYREANTRGLSPVVLYHSRYRYYDRVERQKEVLRHFPKDKNGTPIFGDPVLIIATQVCEMSLDVSAELLITALPPFPPIMQRLGRLNRYARKQEGKADPPCAEALIYPFECVDGKPYFKEELTISQQALENLYDRPISQKDLANELKRLPLYEEIETDSAWLDGIRENWESDQLPLRKSDEPSITVIMEEDLAKIEKGLKLKNKKPTAQSLAAWTIPMLFKKEIPYKSWGILAGYRVVPKEWITYDEKEGAEWRSQNRN
jgi:CRISPR-associated endonuclease/helicase Cas3